MSLTACPRQPRIFLPTRISAGKNSALLSEWRLVPEVPCSPQILGGVGDSTSNRSITRHVRHCAGRATGMASAIDKSNSAAPAEGLSSSLPSRRASISNTHGSAHVSSHRSNNRSAGVVLAGRRQSAHRCDQGSEHSAVRGDRGLRLDRSPGQPAGAQLQRHRVQRVLGATRAAGRFLERRYRPALPVDAIPGSASQGTDSKLIPPSAIALPSRRCRSAALFLTVDA